MWTVGALRDLHLLPPLTSPHSTRLPSMMPDKIKNLRCLEVSLPTAATLQASVFDAFDELEERIFTALQSPSPASTPSTPRSTSSASSATSTHSWLGSCSSSSSSIDALAMDGPTSDVITVRMAMSSLRTVLFNWCDGTIDGTTACLLISNLRNDLRSDVKRSDDMTVTKCLFFVREACSAISRTISTSTMDTFATLFPHKVRSPMSPCDGGFGSPSRSPKNR